MHAEEEIQAEIPTTEITILNGIKKITSETKFEKEIKELFSLPKNIKDIVAEIQSSRPVISLDLDLAASSEEFSFLDYLNDLNII